MAADTSDNKKAMLEALEKSLGIVTTACKTVGISRDTHYRWIKEDQEYREKVDGIAEIALDFVESQHYKQISEGNSANIIYHLKTKGRRRGYIETQNHEISGSIGGFNLTFEQAYMLKYGKSAPTLNYLPINDLMNGSD